MSLGNYARWCLGQVNLTMVEEPHRLLITTPEEASNMMVAEVLPVADLLFTDRVADASLLSCPYMDRDDAVAQRIRAKLKQPVSLNHKQASLWDVLSRMAEQLGENVLVDQKALDDVGAGRDSPVTAVWRGVPARESLRWFLRR